MKKQVVLPFLPGYMFNGHTVLSTGIAIPPTQFIDRNTGEVVYYVRPIFECGGAFVGMYVKHSGIVKWINSTGDQASPSSIASSSSSSLPTT